jgi:putative transposase
MPRQPRPDLAGIPQHVVQRGNDRQPCFFSDADCLRYLTNLREAALRYGVAIHAYVLMTNHVHLLASPGTEGAVSRMMQCLGRHYVPYINIRYRRTGTLWEGRYRSCLVDDGDYLWSCQRYIELNPVRAAIVAAPGDYRWSSHRANADGADDVVLTPHEAYRRLGATPGERQAAYRGLFENAIPEERLRQIREHLRQQRAFGGSRFQQQIEATLGRSMETRGRGRPANPQGVKKSL